MLTADFSAVFFVLVFICMMLLSKYFPLTYFDISKHIVTFTDSFKIHHTISNRLEHPTNMPFLSFIEDDGIMIFFLVLSHFDCSKHFIFIFDTRKHFLYILRFQFLIKFYNIFFFYSEFRMLEFVHQCRIISQKK